MPRTKYVRKRSKQSWNSPEESDLFIQNFEKQMSLKLSELELEAKTMIDSLQTWIDITFSHLPAEVRGMTLGELCLWESGNEEEQKENCEEVLSSVSEVSVLPPPSVVKTKRIKKTTKRTTVTSDDGYVTEGTTTRASRAVKRSSEVQGNKRSSSRSSSRSKKTKLSEIDNPKTDSKKLLSVLPRDNFKTPAVPRPQNMDYGLITPKVKPNTPMSVVRRPRQGEAVFSVQGSPLLVTNVVETANINVPLANGDVISLLPNDGLRMSQLPVLDPETVKQLKTLKSHIEKVLK